jgi:WD40 repeat protein
VHKIPSGAIDRLAFSSDSRTLACLRDKHRTNQSTVREVCIWEVATGLERTRFETDGVTDFVWSPDKRRVATLESESCCVWSTIGGKKIWNKTAPVELSTELPGFACMTFSADSNTLLTGMGDRTILAWDLPSEEHPVTEPSPTDLERFWSDLNTPDGKKAHTAIWSLIDSPDKAIPFLNNHLHPATDKDGQTIERLIVDLDNASFAIRESAQRELTRLYFDAKPFLQAALEKHPSPEVRHRIESILSFPADKPSESLAQLRAIEVLEYAGSNEARRGLEVMAKGAPESRLTQEAKESLERLNLAQKSN